MARSASLAISNSGTYILGIDTGDPSHLEVRMALGEFEQVVLFALVRLRGEAHGAAIIEEIQENTSRKVSPGALYTVLDRLQEKGMVESWIGDSTPERGGRRRKEYRILPTGARSLREAHDEFQRLASGILARLDRLAEGSS